MPQDPAPFDPPGGPTDKPANNDEPHGNAPGPQTPEQPQPQTTDEPAVEPADPANEEASTPAAEQPLADTVVPLPPATGNTLGANDTNTVAMAASVASMLTGLGLFGLVLRKRRHGK
jgi:hypothetical protein